MNQTDTTHAWWSRLRHQGLLLSPGVMLECYGGVPERQPFHAIDRLRDARTRFATSTAAREDLPELEKPAILHWVDALLEKGLGYRGSRRFTGEVPNDLGHTVRIGSGQQRLKPDRVLYADDDRKRTALLLMADTSKRIGRGKGRTRYAQFLELLRGTGHRLGMLTNGQQFRLVYAGLDFEAWCEWEGERWFDDGEGDEELAGLRHLLRPDLVEEDEPGRSGEGKKKLLTAGLPGLLHAVEESRKKQADLSSVLRENVRRSVELLLEDVSAACRSASDNADPLSALFLNPDGVRLDEREANEALFQACVRVVMRLVVCLFAESRGLLPVDDPTYARSYGVRSLYDTLSEAVREEGTDEGLANQEAAWPRLTALFRMIYSGASHTNLRMRAYGGGLFRYGEGFSTDPVLRALHLLENEVQLSKETAIRISDRTVYRILRSLRLGKMRVVVGKQAKEVEGPVDYTDLRTEFIGLIYEGVLDYRLKLATEIQVFLNIGREPVLPLPRLGEMLTQQPEKLKDMLDTLRKEKVVQTQDDDEETEEEPANEEEPQETELVEDAAPADGLHQSAAQAANAWALQVVERFKLTGKKLKRESDQDYQRKVEDVARRLLKPGKAAVAPGEFYLVRAGNTRKGTGTFYTRPQLAVPTTHRTLEPLCYDADGEGKFTVPKRPEEILGLKVCDPACGSASFLVAALHYLTEALYDSLCHHCGLDDPERYRTVTLPFGKPIGSGQREETVPFPPDDEKLGERFPDWVKARLRRHVVERCIYGVDINPLAVEFARVSLWVETLDPDLPFSFLDHKIKVGNSLVGCWLDRTLDYPLNTSTQKGKRLLE